ncbi:MAG: type II toxin-antitoxin system HicA family toxin [Rickettsiales bacterium]
MVSSRNIIKVLERNGFVVKSQNGSHVKLHNGKNKVIVPHPRKDMPIGTFGSIVRQSGLTKQEFEN